MRVFTWLRVAEYSGLTGRKGTALRSVTKVLWFWVVSHTGDKHEAKNKTECVCTVSVCVYRQQGRRGCNTGTQTPILSTHAYMET